MPLSADLKGVTVVEGPIEVQSSKGEIHKERIQETFLPPASFQRDPKAYSFWSPGRTRASPQSILNSSRQIDAHSLGGAHLGIVLLFSLYQLIGGGV